MATPVQSAKSRLGIATRAGDHDKAHAARRDLAAALIAQDIEQRLATAPPLTPEQIERLVGLLQTPAKPARRQRRSA